LGGTADDILGAMTERPDPVAIRLRDVTLADADRFDEIRRLEQTDGGFNDFGLTPTPVDRGILAAGPLRNDEGGVRLIERVEDAEIIGTVGWRRVRYGPNPESDAWQIGIDLVPEARGRGHGTQAQRLLADYLFETTGLHRVEASTDVENLAEQRSLQKAGFTREGVNRQAQYRGGAYHDLVLYARLRWDPV
jgi:RimJ/RimL family protein N-acetyltransferase